MGGLSTTEAGGLATMICGALVSIGAGLRFLIRWRDSRADLREKKLEAWEERLRARDETYHAQVERRFAVNEKKLGVVSAALFATIAEVQLLDPASPALARARLILQQAYPVPGDMPEDIAALVARLGLAAAATESKT